LRGPSRTHRALASRGGSHPVRAWRAKGSALGAWQETRPVLDGGRVGPQRGLVSCFDVFSSREPGSTSLENTLVSQPGTGTCNERSPSCAAAPRPERMEPEKSLYRLEGSRPDGAGHCRGARRRAEAEGARSEIRHCIHLGAETRAAHTGSDAGRTRPERPSHQKKPRT